MAKTNIQRIGDALAVLSPGLHPFVDRECKSAIGEDWVQKFIEGQAAKRGGPKRQENPTDVQFLLKVMWDSWQQIFGKVLSRADRTLVSELIDVRNRWAHQEPFTADDTYRALDSMHRLLQSVSAGDEAAQLDHQRQEVMRLRFEETTKRATKTTEAEGSAVKGLRSWREVITPHADVAAGRFQQAEFAADLAQVHRGEATNEYSDPVQFFRRTFLTDGLKQLLVEALQRLSGIGGGPVVQLQTNFGGGKTHSLLALYHLFSGAKANELLGVDDVLEAAGTSIPEDVTRAVLVGTDISPGQPRVKEDGTEVRTLWGELAWQIGGRAAFDMVAEADRTATNPGDALGKIFKKWGPCLILIDEWVAYARQLHGKSDLPAGTFDTHFTFAQTLTEKAKSAGNTIVVVSIPASEKDEVSEIEVGGEGGRAALERLRNVINRSDNPWQPATTEESFEIVRRRLFEELDKEGLEQRDQVARQFVKFYAAQASEFPAECKEAAYERRIKSAYPIHPELFDRLYNDWSTLERFQRTRGVLRLMAGVIHALWERNDPSPLIMPGIVPIDDPGVLPELTRYLEDNWKPVIESDVDGPNALPKRIDNENAAHLGKFHACRRVARTIYLGSAPKSKGAHKGIDERHIRLGSVLPGEQPAVFGDALRRLTDRSTYLVVEGQSYAYSPNPSLASLAKDRAGAVSEDEVLEEIRARLVKDARKRGSFAAVHAAPSSAKDVPDEAEARLIIVGPEYPHAGKNGDSAALSFSKSVLDERSGGPRRYRNMLVFAAAEREPLKNLKESVRQFLAWSSIVRDAEELNLDTGQIKQASDRRANADGVVDQRVWESYQWLLVPAQAKDASEVSWDSTKIGGAEPIAEKTSKKLVGQEGLITEFGGVRLRLELDRIPLWRGDHVRLEVLWEDFAQYLYLPRLRDRSVLVGAVQDGIASTSWNTDTFAYAGAFDDDSKAYKGLEAGHHGSVRLDSMSVLVRPDIASEHMETGKEPTPGPTPPTPPGPDEVIYKRFYGQVSLDPLKASTQLGQIIESVVNHLQSQPKAEVELTLEIRADVPEGADEDSRRTVTENATTLRFKSHGFERE